jgi:hypothetical protein
MPGICEYSDDPTIGLVSGNARASGGRLFVPWIKSDMRCV